MRQGLEDKEREEGGCRVKRQQRGWRKKEVAVLQEGVQDAAGSSRLLEKGHKGGSKEETHVH